MMAWVGKWVGRRSGGATLPEVVGIIVAWRDTLLHGRVLLMMVVGGLAMQSGDECRCVVVRKGREGQ